MDDRPVATARMTAVVAREPGEPLSPELVLVCPELAPLPEHDARQGIAFAPPVVGRTLRPPIRETRGTETSSGRVEPSPHRTGPEGAAAAGKGRAPRRRISTNALVVIAMATVGILGWRSLSHSTGVRQSLAPPAAGTVTPSAVEPAAATPPSSTDAVAPATATPSSHPAPAGTKRPAGTTPAPALEAAEKPKPANVEQTTAAEEAEEVEPSGIPDTRRPTGPMFAPDVGQRVISRPQLTWDPVADVRGYRFRLYRGKRMLLDVVVHEPKATLADSWRFDGRRVELTPGTYWWYVWPIPQAAHSPPQRLLKASSFILVGRVSR